MSIDVYWFYIRGLNNNTISDPAEVDCFLCYGQTITGSIVPEPIIRESLTATVTNDRISIVTIVVWTILNWIHAIPMRVLPGSI